MRYLGRKSELTSTLRSIGELPPDQRGPVGKAANEVRVALEELLGRAHRRARGIGARPSPGRGPHRRDAAGRPAAARRPPPPRLPDPAPGWRTSSSGSGSRSSRAPRSSTSTTTSPRSTTRPSTRRGRRRTPSTCRSTCCCARTPRRCRCARWRRSRRRSTSWCPGRVYRPDTPDATHVPMFHQLEGLAIDEDITLADLQGVLLAFARQMFGEHTEVRLRPGYFPFTEPSVEVDVSCFRCGGTGYEGSQRCFTCKGEAWIEILGSGMVDPNVLDYVRRQRLRQGARAGLRVRHGDRADRERRPRGARTCACSTRTTRGCWSSSAHEGPGGMAARVLRPRHARRGDRRRAHDGRAQGRAPAPRRRGGRLRVRASGSVLIRRAASGRRPPHRLHGGHRRERAEHDRVRRAQRGGRPDRGGGAPRARSCPTARSSGKAKLRGVESQRDDPGRGRGRDRRGPPGDHGARRRPAGGRAALRAPADHRRGARARDHAEPARRDGRVRRGPRRARRDGRAARRGPDRARRRAERRRLRRGPRERRDRRPRDLPALHRARVRGREDRARRRCG